LALASHLAGCVLDTTLRVCATASANYKPRSDHRVEGCN
jgi:hypothetical protein